jgi:hypothetical protein
MAVRTEGREDTRTYRKTTGREDHKDLTKGRTEGNRHEDSTTR